MNDMMFRDGCINSNWNLFLVAVIKRRLEVIWEKLYGSMDRKNKDIFYYAIKIIIWEQRIIIKGRIDHWKFHWDSKMECPHFDRSDFKGWYLKMEQFFFVDHTRDQDKVRTVMMHLEGKALQWHQRFMKNQRGLSKVDWNQYMG